LKLYCGEKGLDSLIDGIWLIYVLKTLLLPVASLLICAFFASYFVLKNKGKGGVLLITPLFSLYLLSLPIVAISFSIVQQQYSELDYSIVDKIKPQAIVVLSGGIISSAPEYDEDMTVSTRTLVRARYAAYLSKKTKLPLLVSGGHVFDESIASEASVLASVLQSEFMVSVRWMDEQSRNTAENAIYSHNVLSKEGVNRVILVTHASHMKRAAEQFERVGFDIIPAPTSLAVMPKLNIFLFLPSASALEMSSMTIHEWLGCLWYEIKYSYL